MIDQDWLEMIAGCCDRHDWDKLQTELLKAVQDCHELAEKLAVGNESIREGVGNENELREHSERVALAGAAVSLDDFGKAVGLENQTTKTPLPFEIFQQFLYADFHLFYEWNNATALLKRHEGTIAKVVLKRSIIPPEVPTRIDEVRLRLNGQVWEIHATDKDDFPSVPHAHNYGEDLVLDLRNGDLFRVRDLQRRIQKNDLEELRTEFAKLGVGMPPLNFEVSADREARRAARKEAKKKAKKDQAVTKDQAAKNARAVKKRGKKK